MDNLNIDPPEVIVPKKGGFWKTLGMMTAEHGPRCADEEELGGYWQDAARLTGVASTLEALRVGVPAEDVLVGLDEVPERWAISAVNEGSFAI